MLKDLFENNLFSICMADDGHFVISSPINTRKRLVQEDWVIVQIGGKNHITPRPEQGMIGRTCFSPTFTNALTDERRSFGLKGESAENVASRMAERRIGRMRYSVYEPEKLPDCVIDVGVQSGESGDWLVYSLVIGEMIAKK